MPVIPPGFCHLLLTLVLDTQEKTICVTSTGCPDGQATLPMRDRDKITCFTRQMLVQGSPWVLTDGKKTTVPLRVCRDLTEGPWNYSEETVREQSSIVLSLTPATCHQAGLQISLR